MITLIFDALHGQPYRDSEAFTLVTQTVEDSNHGDVTVSVANRLHFDAFRAAVRNQQIAIDAITIVIVDEHGKNHHPKLYPSGGLVGWQPCLERWDDILIELL